VGSAYIGLARLGLMGPPLWGALAVVAVYAFAVFRWV
jgi:predicted small integral membrane protein